LQKKKFNKLANQCFFHSMQIAEDQFSWLKRQFDEMKKIWSTLFISLWGDVLSDLKLFVLTILLCTHRNHIISLFISLRC
jgi:hypothetical protein